VREEQNIAEEAESEDSSDDHFVRKIKENKELIKQTKHRNQQARKENQQANNYIGNFQKRGSAKVEGRQGEGEGMRRQSQRRQREVSRRMMGKESAPHRNSSALKEAPPNREIAVREFKSKDELTPLNKILPSPLAHRETEKDREEKKLKKQLSAKHLTPVQKNEQLFDAIHNYLENPKRSEPEILNPAKIGQSKAEL
jgi:hypothetical protein